MRAALRRVPTVALLTAALTLASSGIAVVARTRPPHEPVATINPFTHDVDSLVEAAPSVHQVRLRHASTARVMASLEAVVEPAVEGTDVAFLAERPGRPAVVVARGTTGSDGIARARWRASETGIYTVRSAVTGTQIVSAPSNISFLARGVRVIRWREWLEPGLERHREEFVRTLRDTFADARGWGATGAVTFVYVPKGRVDVLARLATPKTTDRLCLPADTRGKWSCHNGGGIVINSDRWFDGSPTLDMPVSEYRWMVINHEVGHALGYRHVGCGEPGTLAPIMMQQSKGLHGCRANAWPLASELSRL